MSYRRRKRAEIGSTGRAIRKATERQRGAVLAVALVAGALATPAPAAPFNPSLERAYGLAERYWGGGPVGCASLERQIVPDGSLGEAAAVATLTVPGQSWPCVLYVERRLAKPSVIGAACMVMIHELGHLRGLAHSEDPTSIMHGGQLPKLPGICYRASWRWAVRGR